MSAFVIVESIVRNAEVRDQYAPLAKAGIEAAGGEIIASGHWTVLAGQPSFENGLLIRFEDRAAALSWFSSQTFASLTPLRDTALDTRFSLVG